MIQTIQSLFLKYFLRFYIIMQYFQSHKFKEGDSNFEDIQVGQTIGNGNSSVFAIQFKNNPAAMKEVIIKNQQQAKHVANEIQMMKTLSSNSEFIIKYLGSFTTIREIGQYNMSQMTYIIMEKADLSLEQLIQCRIRSREVFLETQIIKIMKVLIHTLCHLQKSGIAHCDVKPENILIMNMNTLDIKLCDIGSCRTTKQSTQEATLVGTVPFLAPQLIRDFTKDRVVNNPFKSDVFSLGLCFIYLLTFKKFKSSQRLKINQNVYREIIMEWIQEAKDKYFKHQIISNFLDLFLEFDQKKRHSFQRIDELLKQSLLELSLKKNQELKDIKKRQELVYIQKTKKPICSYHSIPTESRKTQDLRQSTSHGFRMYLNPIVEGPSSSKYKRKLITKKSQNFSISNQTSTFSPLFSKRKSSNTIKTNTTSIDESPKLKHEGNQKTQLFQQVINRRVIFVNSENIEDIKQSQIKWAQKLIIFDGFYQNLEGVKQMTFRVDTEFQIQAFIYNIKKSEFLVSLMIDMRSLVLVNGLKLQSFNSSKCLSNLSLLLDDSSIKYYNNLFQILISPAVKKLHISLKNSSISCENICQLVIWIIQNLQLESLFLNLEDLKLTEKQNKIIIQNISKIKKLKFLRLNLSKNNIFYTIEHLWQFPKSLDTLSLNYSHNDMRSALNYLSNFLPKISESLKSLILNLEDTSLSSKEVNFLFNSLTKLQLQTLSIKLGQNQIDDSFCKYISKTMILLSHIQQLQIGLENTSITLEGFLIILNTIDKMFEKKLKQIIFLYNRFSSRQGIVEMVMKNIKSEVKFDVSVEDSFFRLTLKTNQGSPLIKSKKSINKNFFCERLHKMCDNFKKYICLTCIEKNPINKNMYFCSFCSQNCKHIGHNLIPTYKNVECGCIYVHCKTDINQVPCSKREGTIIQKGSRCLLCEKTTLCVSCAKLCKGSHNEFVIDNQHLGLFKCCSSIQQN